MFAFINDRNCHHGNALPWICDCSKTVRLSTGFQSRSQMATQAQLSRRRRKCFFGPSAHACLDRRKRGLAAASGIEHRSRMFDGNLVLCSPVGLNASWSTSTDFVFRCTRAVTSTMTNVSRQGVVTRWSENASSRRYRRGTIGDRGSASHLAFTNR